MMELGWTGCLNHEGTMTQRYLCVSIRSTCHPANPCKLYKTIDEDYGLCGNLQLRIAAEKKSALAGKVVAQSFAKTVGYVVANAENSEEKDCVI